MESQSSYKRKTVRVREGNVTEAEIGEGGREGGRKRLEDAGFEDERRGHEPRDVGSPLNWKRILPSEPLEGTSPANTLILAQLE